MKIEKMKSALQNLIIRLQDSEKGYMEIYNGTNNVIIKQWMKKYGTERHGFHKDLEIESKKLGGNPEVKTSILGDIHRMFIDFKLHSIDSSIESIINEIERGGNKLIEEYDNAINVCSSNDELIKLMEAQKWKIQNELKSLTLLRDELLAVEV